MKNYKFTLLVILGLLFFNCSLEEEPPYLANENVYGSARDITSATIGMYNSLTSYDYYSSQFTFFVNLNSGFGVTKRGGNRITSLDMSTTGSLKPTANTLQSSKAWKGLYSGIARTNDAIKSAIPTENPETEDERVINDAIGQAYFLRAFHYFNLVRLWGEVPLRLEPTNAETVHMAKSSIADVYGQIISDGQNALKYMNGSIGDFAAKPFAANMLMAKVYMTLATAPADHLPSAGNYWQMAYNEAKKVYGQYSLVADYAELFDAVAGNNTVESIFEVQSDPGATLKQVHNFTPSQYTKSGTFGWLKVNPEVYQRQVDTYPGDPRLGVNYISSWTKQNNGKTDKHWPERSRASFNNGFPWCFKLGANENQIQMSSTDTSKNFKIYRYADLLLMLAEISNELENGEGLGYVTEVLDRVSLTPQDSYSGGQEAFRDAIMREYEFELMWECHDWFNNRRRGYDWFNEKIIIPHNTATTFDVKIDVVLDDNKLTIMHLPMPADEINNNELISE